ncbi:signal recognition particle-docking protein FtsY [Corynebacterium sp. TAE3-ERU2]|uniref:signal recognition particle-docking protein FtsY n=1 Tax=Corynebacterium sp. TAE3-ERU2 TaxID=2849497 RepID=UPI0021048A79|nr:signal recognition particle-docking protein FtsY [Corynebacterium sp. TAE3-ERU2]
MNTTYIIAAVVVVLLLLIALIVIGLKRKQAKTVSFEKEEEETKELTREEKSGNYQAQGGFNFAPAAGSGSTPKKKEPELLDGQRLDSPQPSTTPQETPQPEPTAAPEQEPVAEPSEPSAAEEQISSVEEGEVDRVEQDAVAQPPRPAEPEAETPATEPEAPTDSEIPAEPEAPADSAPTTAAEQISSVEDAEVDRVEAEKATEQPAPAPVEDAPAEAEDQARSVSDGPAPLTQSASSESYEQPVVPEAETAAEDETPAADDAEQRSGVDKPAVAAAEESDTAVVEPEPDEVEREDIAPAEGRLGKLRGRLSRSQNVIGQSVLGILSAGDLDEDAWEEIEDTLIMADLGSTATMKIVDDLREKIAARGVSSEQEARAMLRETLIEACQPELDRSIRAIPNEGKPAVVLVVGVNGTGKTTTTGKLARVLVSMGHNVVLGAADTFRAAAADQLDTWGTRVGATTVRGKEGADPASVAFDAVAQGIEQHADVVLIDTAGRLHTSQGLMDQLGKVKRVVEKKAEVDEVLLVLDATVGQNGLIQARTFRDVVDISGVVLTKLDGTAKGGIVFQVQEELGVPVKLVGLGEGADDLAPFEPESFVDALLG